MGETVKFKAGKYYIGDLCYVISDDNWDSLLDQTNYLSGKFFKFKEYECFADSTAYGDGCYYDNYNRKYAVDAGIIGVMPYEALDINLEGEGGLIIEFENDFTVFATEGYFEFGNIEIDTR